MEEKQKTPPIKREYQYFHNKESQASDLRLYYTTNKSGMPCIKKHPPVREGVGFPLSDLLSLYHKIHNKKAPWLEGQGWELKKLITVRRSEYSLLKPKRKAPKGAKENLNERLQAYTKKPFKTIPSLCRPARHNRPILPASYGYSGTWACDPGLPH